MVWIALASTVGFFWATERERRRQPVERPPVPVGRRFLFLMPLLAAAVGTSIVAAHHGRSAGTIIATDAILVAFAVLGFYMVGDPN